ncbi:MAG: tetratricopeptide repeat protein [Treponema sp.]|nr:tetratricopeptide repeat protein [Treponema sp.]
MKTGYRILIVLCALLLAQGCSSRPRNRGETFDVRRQAESQLQHGNRQADRGDHETALFLIDDAMRLAILADDSGLRVRVGLSRGNVLSTLGYAEEAAGVRNAALAEALFSGNRELVALCRVHIARAEMLSLGSRDAARAVVDQVTREKAFLVNHMYVAFAWSLIGRAEGMLGRYAHAEVAVRHSLAIHERHRNLELAALDWFMIASFRSRAGDFDGARQALETSILLDRRVENSWGLASSWRALGDVERRAGNRDAAGLAYTRAAEIFRALGNDPAADDALSRIEAR